MSRTYYFEKTHKLSPGWVTKCEHMQKNHITLAVLWNPAAELPYCVQYAESGHYFADIKEVLFWIIKQKPKLIPPEEIVREFEKQLKEERETEENEERKIVFRCDETIKGLIKAKPHISQNGTRDYDKVDYRTVEDAICLIRQYRATLRTGESDG